MLRFVAPRFRRRAAKFVRKAKPAETPASLATIRALRDLAAPAMAER